MKIGIIGTGNIVENFLEAVKEVPEINCLALCSRKQSKEKAEKLAENYNIKKQYYEFDEMVKDNDINFIYIASPNSLHYNYALKALENGKNVINEKPFSTTEEETKKLIETAKKNKLFIFEAITTIHLPNYKKISENIDKIKPLKLIQCNYSQYSSRYDDFLAGNLPNVFNPKFSGGALYDINIYNIYFVVGLFGRPKEAFYYANISRGIDTSGIAVLIYDDFICECCGAKDSESPSYAVIQGENGYIKLNSPANTCKSFEVGILKQNKEEYNYQKIENRMVYELKEFLSIYKNKDYEKAEKFLSYTSDVMNTIVNLRKSAGIVFDNDKKTS